MATGSPASQNQDRGTPPVFIPCKNLPAVQDSDSQFSVRELCAAGEKTCGYGTVIGAQRIGGLWRVYPKNNQARIELLLKGIQLRGLTVSPFDKNPFIVRSADGDEEVKTTKLIIGNIPISYSNDEIEKKVVQMGCKPQSKLMMEKDRDERGGLTRWLTGRRFVYIQIPDQPLPTKINIGSATASLYHREQKFSPEHTTCSRCLVKGHYASSCPEEVVCKTCRRTGHKSGHPSCSLLRDVREAQAPASEQLPAEVSPSEDSAEDGASAAATQFSTPETPSSRPARAIKQSKLAFHRSQSCPREKRPLSSPVDNDAAKAARRDDLPLGPTTSSLEEQCDVAAEIT